ncbi:MAG: ABC transporter ATP-binding protein/permease [Verrucomicrobiales bacterium]|jgi:subfamily B ATP-binding cassette protein MsbA|nr:ABC transporter ATP-binding protein/permease [Verrucomicrobiales bacterium]
MRESWPILRRFYGYLKPYSGILTVIFAQLIIVTVLDLVQPKLIGKMIDAAQPAAGYHGVLLLVWVFLAVIAVRSVILLYRNYLMQRTGMRVTCDMRVRLFAHLQKLSIKFYEDKHTGKIVSRISEDTSWVHNMVTGASINLIGDAIMIVGVLAFMWTSNLVLAAITMAFMPLFLVNFLWHRRRMRVESRIHRHNWDKVIGFLYERVASARLIKAFAMEDREVNTFRHGIETDYRNYNRIMWRSALLSVGANILGNLGTLAVVAYGAWLVVSGAPHFTIGDLLAFLLFLGFLYPPITRIVDANAVIQRALASLEKIFTLLDTQPHVPQNDALPALQNVAGAVSFDHVAFSYRPGQATLTDVNFTVSPGEMIALVGPSGAGKTTIITLLARFYEPDAGRILIDGHNIQDYNVQSLRQQVGIVMQDNLLFAGTIESNIKYGRPGASREAMLQAAIAANAHEFIAKQKKGYDSMLGERGVQLSGGQKQRIAIARVILKDPRILILDEATSALDTQSEHLIQEALERLMQNRTSFVIAHRLSTVVNADRILVMDAGRIVETGRHEELLARNGLYSRLYNLQFKHEE